MQIYWCHQRRTSSFFDISKSTWWNVWYHSTYITGTCTKLSWTLDKVDENEFNLIEKYVCAAYDPHNHFRTSGVNRLRFFLFTKLSENNLRRLSLTKEALQLHILRSAYAAGGTWSVILQPSDQMPSQVDWRWKYFNCTRIAVDCCGVYDVNLNGYIFSCTYKGLVSSTNVWRKQYHVFHFVVVSVLQKGKIVYILHWEVYLYIWTGIFKTQSNIYHGAFLWE